MRKAGIVALCAVAFTTVAAGSAHAGGGLFVGFSDDRPKWEGARIVAPAQDLGARAFRVAVRWDGVQTFPNGTQLAELDQVSGATGGARLVLTVVGTADAAPQTDVARDAYCTFARNVLGRYPGVSDVILWGEPNKSMFWRPQFNPDGTSAAPAAYAALAARCWDVLHASFPAVNVIGPALSSNGNDNPAAGNNVSHSPGNFIRALGVAYRASGRSAPIFDTIAHHPYGATPSERPWRQHIGSKIIAQGDWNKLMYNLWQAFDGTAQPLPGQCTPRCTTIWYTEAGYETSVDAAKAALYSGAELAGGIVPDFAGGEPESPAPSEASAAPDQWTQALDGIRLAYCQPYVGAYFNFLVSDEARLEGWQSGAYWADLTPKDSLPAFRQVIAEVNGASVDCSLKGGVPSNDYFPPAAPSAPTAEVQRDPLRVVLSWTPPADNVGVTSYRVYRNGAQVATTTEATWTNSGVADATTYSYTIRALDDAGNMGDASVPVSVTTPDLSPPTVPTNVTATAASPTRIDLTWTASTDKVGVAGYRVYRDGVEIATTATPAYADTAVAPATSYAYSVAAFDAAGNVSAASAPVTVTTQAAAPPAEVSKPYSPTSYSILRGSVYPGRGAVSRLAADDSARLELVAAKSGPTYTADVFTSATIGESRSAVRKLVLEYDGNASRSDASVTLSVYDWRTGAWVSVDGPRFATTTDRSFTWSTTTPLDFVSATGELRLRAHSTSSRSFVGRIDLVRFTITY